MNGCDGGLKGVGLRLASILAPSVFTNYRPMQYTEKGHVPYTQRPALCRILNELRAL